MTVSLVQVKQGLSPLLEQRGDEQMKVKPTKAPRKRKWELLLQPFREEGPGGRTMYRPKVYVHAPRETERDPDPSLSPSGPVKRNQKALGPRDS